MVVYRLEKKGLNDFLSKLKECYPIIAPVSDDLVRWKKVDDIDDINLDEQPYFPLKEFFFRKKEAVFRFDGDKVIPAKVKAQPTVFFGIRRCDLHAVERQDIVYMKDARDPHYIEARHNSFLLGYHCNTAPGKHCFCGSMDLEEFHDLMFFDEGDHYLLEVGSDKGKGLIADFRNFFTKTNEISDERKIIPETDKLKNKDISNLYNNTDWKKGVDLCFSCAACTILCPTCYCFQINDEIRDDNGCDRCREWSSCQLQSFTRVAGDHVFRKERDARFKHRIYHQMQYFKEHYGKNLCVGCGRCITGCPTEIDWIKILNEMNDG
ncbi:MAG: 4Fe-4S dicluster domain-containing protein [Candidatus Nanoarchaeia archaeon]